jgi:hypothetical protein
LTFDRLRSNGGSTFGLGRKVESCMQMGWTKGISSSTLVKSLGAVGNGFNASQELASRPRTFT